MSMRVHRLFFHASRIPMALAILATAGLAIAQPSASPPPATAPSAAATSEGVRDRLLYTQHISFLANPFMEGRGPGTRGNALAADYIEHQFRTLGLKPILPAAATTASDSALDYRQPFNAPGFRIEAASTLSIGDLPLAPIPLGCCASASITAPLVFVGYAIQNGGPEKNYQTFSDADSLEGKIAVMLRFEPMNADGKSKWRGNTDGAWTGAAGISAKIQEVVKRKAAGLIIVMPPGTDDPRAIKPESAELTTRWARELSIPAAMLTAAEGDTLIKSADPARSLLELRKQADDKGLVAPLGDKPATLSVTIERTPRATCNVAAVLPGRGGLSEQFVIVGGHYDHVGYGHTGGSRSNEYGVVHPGADDNASGSSGVLLAADILSRRYAAAPADQPLRSILFIAFSAEEMGLIGSREFVKNSPIAAAKIAAMLNMDMIGRLRPAPPAEGETASPGDLLEVTGTGTAEGFESIINPIFDRYRFKVKAIRGGSGPSDHATFYGAGIPVLHMFTGLHDEYHTPRDTVDLINVDGALRVVNATCDIALAISERPEPLKFIAPPRETADAGDAGPSMRGLKVRFGIAPGDYDEESKIGVPVADVTDGTSAAEAGIQKGDVLIKWNGEPIENVRQWMGHLAKHNPGDVVDVTVLRKKDKATPAEEHVMRVTLKSRDQEAR